QVLSARLELARLSVATGKPDDAIQFAQEVLKAQPSNGDAQAVYGRALLMKGNLAAAEPQMRQLATAYPKSAEAQTQLGQMFLTKGDATGARRAFDQALTLDPNNAGALAGLTMLDLQAKNPS